MGSFNARRGGRRGIVLCIVALGALVAGGIAYATIPGGGQVYTGCMLKNIGTVRLIDPSLPASNLMSHCTVWEAPISWNQQGQQGAPGPAGAIGAKGDTGATGPAGAAGSAGAAGDAGATGASGATGPQGPKGDTGDPGLAGAPGAAGDAGAVGSQGPQGDTGPQGPAGQQGPIGPAGADGSSSTVYHVSVHSNGIAASSGNSTEVTGVSQLSTGRYSVTFGPDVLHCGRVASLGTPSDGSQFNSTLFPGVRGEIATFFDLVTHGIVVDTFDLTGAFVNRDFQLMVVC